MTATLPILWWRRHFADAIGASGSGPTNVIYGKDDFETMNIGGQASGGVRTSRWWDGSSGGNVIYAPPQSSHVGIAQVSTGTASAQNGSIALFEDTSWTKNANKIVLRFVVNRKNKGNITGVDKPKKKKKGLMN